MTLMLCAYLGILLSLLLAALLVVLWVAWMLLTPIWYSLPPHIRRSLIRIVAWLLLWVELTIYIGIAAYIGLTRKGPLHVPLNRISVLSWGLAFVLMMLATLLWSKSKTFRALAKPVAVVASVILLAYIVLIAAPLYVFSYRALHTQHAHVGQDPVSSNRDARKSDPCAVVQQGHAGTPQPSTPPRCISWYYQFNPAGMRKWVLVGDDTWDESYPPDPKVRDEFHISGNAIVGGVHGVIAYKVSMSNFEVFIPDAATPKPFFILMRWRNGHQAWTRLGEAS
jgi:hypothetical protein